MKTQFWLTLQVPVEAENPADAMDLGWEKIIDPEGPPEGLVECVTAEKPALPACLADAFLDGKLEQIIAEANAPKAPEAVTEAFEGLQAQ